MSSQVQGFSMLSSLVQVNKPVGKLKAGCSTPSNGRLESDYHLDISLYNESRVQPSPQSSDTVLWVVLWLPLQSQQQLLLQILAMLNSKSWIGLKSFSHSGTILPSHWSVWHFQMFETSVFQEYWHWGSLTQPKWLFLWMILFYVSTFYTAAKSFCFKKSTPFNAELQI